MKNESTCKKRTYCSFKPILLAPDAQVEVCVFCGKKVIYNIRGGRIDNAKYARDHIRDFAQPFGRTAKIFREIYGKQGLIGARKHATELKARKTKDQIQEDWERTSEEAKKDMRRMDDYGKFTTTSGL